MRRNGHSSGVLDQLSIPTFMSGSKFHSCKPRFAPVFVPTLCTFLRDELRSMKLIFVGGLAEAVTAFISILTTYLDFMLTTCQMQV